MRNHLLLLFQQTSCFPASFDKQLQIMALGQVYAVFGQEGTPTLTGQDKQSAPSSSCNNTHHQPVKAIKFPTPAVESRQTNPTSLRHSMSDFFPGRSHRQHCFNSYTGLCWRTTELKSQETLCISQQDRWLQGKQADLQGCQV